MIICDACNQEIAPAQRYYRVLVEEYSAGYGAQRRVSVKRYHVAACTSSPADSATPAPAQPQRPGRFNNLDM